MNFLRNLLASILGTLVALGIFFFMFFVFMAAVGSTEDAPKVRSNSVLDLTYEGVVVDYAPGDKNDPFSSFGSPSVDFVDILHAIETAKGDEKILGIRMNSSFFFGGWTQADAIRSALEDFRESGKFVYAYSDIYTQKDYYIASAADSVFISPVGSLELKGLGSEVLYLKELQEKTGVKMEVIRHGEYKSAVEPFLNSQMSAENREQISELLLSLWAHIGGQIAESRGISMNDLNEIADRVAGRMPENALKYQLVDAVVYPDERDALTNKRMGRDEGAKIRSISLEDYMQVASRKKNSSKNRIAVIHAQGEIFYGEGDESTVGQVSMTRAIRKAVSDDKVKAIVLRVNSPGGSALTSDLIWRELERAKEKKPVYASFGDVAASGGYYIAAGADKIFAENNTVTGSIGVFGVVPNMTELADDIGINAEQVGTHSQSVTYSVFDPMSDAFRNQLYEDIEKIYDTFITRVADGRNMSKTEVDKIGRGRVWSGSTAKKLNLVDEIGSLDDAIAAAAKAAEIEDYQIVRYPRFKTGLEKLLEELSSAETRIGEKVLESQVSPELYEVYRLSRDMQKIEGIQVRMPYHLTIE